MVDIKIRGIFKKKPEKRQWVKKAVSNLSIADLARIDEKKLQSAIKLRRKNLEAGEKEHIKRQKLLEPHQKKTMVLRNKINATVQQIRNLEESEVSTKGVELGFQLQTLTEESNKVAHSISELGSSAHIYDKIPSDTAMMIYYLDRIRNNKIFRVPKRK